MQMWMEADAVLVIRTLVNLRLDPRSIVDATENNSGSLWGRIDVYLYGFANIQNFSVLKVPSAESLFVGAVTSKYNK